jgi:hypothetical protein
MLIFFILVHSLYQEFISSLGFIFQISIHHSINTFHVQLANSFILFFAGYWGFKLWMFCLLSNTLPLEPHP